MAAWAGLGYYARARNLLACARVVARERGGRFPATEAGAAPRCPASAPTPPPRSPPSPSTAPAVVVDGNVERVMARLFAVEEPLPAAKPRLRALAAGLTPAARPGDYAQAVMDLGATICTPRAPACGICPWMARLRRPPRSASPPSCPAAARSRRSPSATAPPGSRSAPTAPSSSRPARRAASSAACSACPATPGPRRRRRPRPPFAADWRDLGEVRHTFTHFHLILRLRGARLPAGLPAPATGARPRRLPPPCRASCARP